MMVVVVPKVTAIFASLDRALPWYTEMLICISHVIASNADARVRHLDGHASRFDALGAAATTRRASARKQNMRASSVVAAVSGDAAHLARLRRGVAGRVRARRSASGVVAGLAHRVAHRVASRRRRVAPRRTGSSSSCRSSAPLVRMLAVVALLADAGDAPAERRAAAQGDGHRQERARQRASSRRSSRRPPAVDPRGRVDRRRRSSAAATSRRS